MKAIYRVFIDVPVAQGWRYSLLRTGAAAGAQPGIILALFLPLWGMQSGNVWLHC